MHQSVTRLSLVFLLTIGTYTGLLSQIDTLCYPGQVVAQYDSSSIPRQVYHKVVSYSFNRGITDSLSTELKGLAHRSTLPEIRADSIQFKETLASMREVIGFINGEDHIYYSGRWAFSKREIRVLSEEDIFLLNQIFKHPIHDSAPGRNCLPVFRDALVFFDEDGEVLQTIEFCHDCLVIRTDPNLDLFLTTNQWNDLRKYFQDLGHPVDER